MPTIETLIGTQHPQRLRKELQYGEPSDMRRRRAVIVLSLFGMLNMAYVTLFQTGVIKHLKDPPWRRFRSDTVNSSDTAYQYGVPDGTVDLVMLAINVLLAATGGAKRAAALPLAPVLLAGKATAEGVGAAWYFNIMRKMNVWCIYCILTALVHLLVLPLTWPEARHAALKLVRK